MLGHMQQGGWPSPFDRYMGIFLNWTILLFCFLIRNVATKMAAKTVSWLIDQLNTCAARDGGSLFLIDYKF